MNTVRNMEDSTHWRLQIAKTPPLRLEANRTLSFEEHGEMQVLPRVSWNLSLIFPPTLPGIQDYCVYNLPATVCPYKLSKESVNLTLIWQNIKARMNCSVSTCPQSKFHFVVQNIANIQHAAAQPAHMTETMFMQWTNSLPLNLYPLSFWKRTQNSRNIGIGTVRQSGPHFSEQIQLLISKVATMCHHCLSVKIVTISVAMFISQLSSTVLPSLPCQ